MDQHTLSYTSSSNKDGTTTISIHFPGKGIFSFILNDNIDQGLFLTNGTCFWDEPLRLLVLQLKDESLRFILFSDSMNVIFEQVIHSGTKALNAAILVHTEQCEYQLVFGGGYPSCSLCKMNFQITGNSIKFGRNHIVSCINPLLGNTLGKFTEIIHLDKDDKDTYYCKAKYRRNGKDEFVETKYKFVW